MNVSQPAPSGRRLALFFDGTWNKPESNTNVWRLYLMLADKGDDGVPQIKYYDQGVGTKWFDRLLGGAFGWGLSENVRAGYSWLMEHFNPGDEIFVFGFSRGAFTARSLTGIIARCGLLKPDAPISFAQLYERYQKGDTVRPIYELLYFRKPGDPEPDFEERILLKHSHYQRNFIKMVGVWDTVGSLGIPFGGFQGISRKTLRFHNTHLSKIVQHSYQAVALDEFRKPYWAVLWTNFAPEKPNAVDASQVDNRHVEQRWFAGAHCNVGGGYRNDLLSQRPLAWIQEKATSCGLTFRSRVNISDEDYEQTPRDSYAEFIGGVWKWFAIFKLCRRYVRWVMSDPVKKHTHKQQTEQGWVQPVNERIDLSVFRRCQKYKDYRPTSLNEWKERKEVDLEAVIAAPEKFPQYWSAVTTTGIETTVKCAESSPH